METQLMIARQLALTWHKDQLYGDVPYLVHLERVVAILMELNLREWQQAAGYVHDILEDTACTELELEQVLGRNVASWVKAVTGVGATRKERQLHIVYQLTHVTPEATILKLGDRLANVEMCVEKRDLKRLAMYRKEQAMYQSLFLRANKELSHRLDMLLALQL